MRATVRDEMTEAVTAYEEKPREQWLFDYPAQVSAVVHLFLVWCTGGAALGLFQSCPFLMVTASHWEPSAVLSRSDG